MKAVKALHTYRPAADQLLVFMMKAMQGASAEELKALAPAEKTDENARIYAYLKDNGAFKLLKPALLAVDKHRPDEPEKYIATFMAAATETITES